MKKIITLILVFGMIITATACGASSANTGSSDAESKKDTTSVSEKKEETKKEKEDEKHLYMQDYSAGYEVKVPIGFRIDSVGTSRIARTTDNGTPREEQEYILITGLYDETSSNEKLKEIPQILEPRLKEMMNKYKPSRFYKTYAQKYDSVEECDYNGYKMLKVKGSITGTNFDGDEETTVNYVAYYFLMTIDTGFNKLDNAPCVMISYTEKTDKESLKNIEEYADTAAESIRIYK
jgi:hypothetical protein